MNYVGHFTPSWVAFYQRHKLLHNTSTINIFWCLVPAKDPCLKPQKEVPDQYKTLALIASGGADDCLTEGQTLGFMAI